MAGTNLFTKKTSTLEIALTDEDGNACFARSVGTPPTTASLFAIGCQCVDITKKVLYINNGTVAIPVWDAVGMGMVEQTVSVADFTDGGSTAGTLELTDLIPAGAIVTQAMISAVTGFAGDTSAVITIGDGSTADRYNTGTPNVFTTAAHISAGAVSGTAYDLAAVTPTLTITSATDFGLVVTNGLGALTVRIYFYLP